MSPALPVLRRPAARLRVDGWRWAGRIVLVLLLLGAIPSWGHSRSWGYGPSGILGLILVVVVILVLLKYI